MLPVHPLAELLPPLKNIDDLALSIAANGLYEPIVLLDGAILDGRARYRACLEAGVEPRTRVFDGDDPLQFVIEANRRSRDLTGGQRALIGARLATLKNGHRPSEPDARGIAAGAAARLMRVAKNSIWQAKLVLAHGTPEEIRAAWDGQAGVKAAADRICLEHGIKRRKLAGVGKNSQRVETLRLHVEIWSRLQAALEGLTNLPRPDEVVRLVRGNPSRRRATEARLTQSLKWLTEFHAAWSTAGDPKGETNGGSGNDQAAA